MSCNRGMRMTKARVWSMWLSKIIFSTWLYGDLRRATSRRQPTAYWPSCMWFPESSNLAYSLVTQCWRRNRWTRRSVLEKKFQRIFPTFLLAYLVNIYSFGAWCKYVWYIQHDMPNFPMFYSTRTWYKCQAFMLALLCLYFSSYIFISAGKKSKILC